MIAWTLRASGPREKWYRLWKLTVFGLGFAFAVIGRQASVIVGAGRVTAHCTVGLPLERPNAFKRLSGEATYILVNQPWRLPSIMDPIGAWAVAARLHVQGTCVVRKGCARAPTHMERLRATRIAIAHVLAEMRASTVDKGWWNFRLEFDVWNGSEKVRTLADYYMPKPPESTEAK